MPSSLPNSPRERSADDDLQPLMAEIAAGQAQAFADLYGATATRVKAISRAVLRSPEDAEEIVGDVFLYVWTNAHRYDECRGSVMAWLAVITRNRSIDRIRSRRLLVALQEDAVSAVSTNGEHDSEAPEQLADKRQQIHQVRQILATLPPLRRQLISLAFLRGLAHAEIAGVVDLPLGTVKSHLRRTLIGIRAGLQH
jgi:RNA polymerase sigma-70 factor (ECF subfamily)